MRQIGKATIDVVDAGRSGDRRILKLRAACGEITLEKSLTLGLGGEDAPDEAIEAEIAAFAAQVQRVSAQSKLVDEYLVAFKSR